MIGKPVFTYGYSDGQQKLNHKISLLNGGDYARRANAYAATQDINTVVLPFTDAQIADLDKTGGTDWQDEIYRKGSLQNHLLSLSGGSDNVRYFVSGGYMDQQGLVKTHNTKGIHCAAMSISN